MNISIAIAQTKQNIVNVLNQSQLPMSILSEIMNNLSTEATLKAQEELKIELQKEKDKKETEDSENKKEE